MGLERRQPSQDFGPGIGGGNVGVICVETVAVAVKRVGIVIWGAGGIERIGIVTRGIGIIGERSYEARILRHFSVPRSWRCY